jgi:predicted dithiol-disulfide oxidoreductase (DUF899 family)
MAKPKVASREQWLAARLDLLTAEKELTRRSDELARQRQELPWVRIDKEYRFETEEGAASLADLFRGRSQLLVYHFMFGPDYTAGCPRCSAIADGFNGCAVHLANHDVMFWAVSRAPLEKLAPYMRRMGWSFPWASSFASDFNYDFAVSFTPQQQSRAGSAAHNFRPFPPEAWKSVLQATQGLQAELAAACGTEVPMYLRELPGMSAFALEGGDVYHTYSAYERGLDVLWSTYQWLDRAPRGRNEPVEWWCRHDEYGKR